jgi:hypothetical protein
MLENSGVASLSRGALAIFGIFGQGKSGEVDVRQHYGAQCLPIIVVDGEIGSMIEIDVCTHFTESIVISGMADAIPGVE